MPRIIRALSALLAVLVVGFALGACGGDDEAEAPTSGSQPSSESSPAPSGEEGGTLIEADPANEGKSFTVGSKNFAEQYILGEIYAQALEAAGFTVKKQLDLGSEQIAFKALQSGRIDAYPEYTGTALTSFYRVKIDDIPRDAQESFDLLAKEAQGDNLTALPQTPFQNTFVVTSTQEKKAELGEPTTLSDLAKEGSDISISGFPECRQRTDCLLGLRDTYGWKPEFVSSQGKFEDLDKGVSDLTFGFGTDGELALTEKYATYEDDKQLFPPYFITLLTSQDGIDKLGDAGKAVIAKIQEPLTEAVMQELNSRVTIDKQKPEDVAADYLKSAGFTE